MLNINDPSEIPGTTFCSQANPRCLMSIEFEVSAEDFWKWLLAPEEFFQKS